MEEAINIGALKAGNQNAFRVLVETFQDRVFNTCLGFLENREEAEDAAQETFIEVFRSIKEFRDEARLSTWVYRIAVTKSLLAIRRKKRKKRFAVFYPHDKEGVCLQDLSDQDDRNQPFARLENAERARVLYTAMNRLAESQRAAFTLHKIDGLSHEEIGEIMNSSLSSVESLIHRAKKNLKKYLYDYYQAQLD